jgi:hypothetical protein
MAIGRRNKVIAITLLVIALGGFAFWIASSSRHSLAIGERDSSTDINPVEHLYCVSNGFKYSVGAKIKEGGVQKRCTIASLEWAVEPASQGR